MYRAERISIHSGPPKIKFSAQRDLCAPRKQRTRTKRQKLETEDEGEGEENKGEGSGRVVLGNNSLDTEETDVAHTQMVVYKAKGGKPVLG